MKRFSILPNVFTSMNLLCGLLAAIKILDGDLITASWLILIAILFDGLDGQIARLTKSESKFGLNYDSLADMVSFGIAPTLLIYSVLSLKHTHLAATTAVLFGVCCALRLARYNIQASTIDKNSFIGMPSPASAGIIASALLLMQNSNSILIEKIFLFLPMITSFLMVSVIEYPKINPLHILKERQIRFPLFLVMSIAFSYIIITLGELALFLIFSAYLGYGLCTFIVNAATSHPGEEPILDFDEEEEEEDFIESEKNP